MVRIAPAEPPYEPEIAAALARIMPTGVPPLALFRTMARSPRVFGKLFDGGLLDLVRAGRIAEARERLQACL